jgi:hypothetical protein
MTEDAEEALREEIEKRRKELPDSVKQSPAYRGARAERIGGIVAMGVGAGAGLFGAIWLVGSSVRFGEPRNEGGQIGGGLLMGSGVVALTIGGIIFYNGKSQTRKIENDYLQRTMPYFRADVGLGSVIFSGAF